MSETPRDRKDLKIQALLEKVSSLTTQYENQVADLRVELTISESMREGLIERVKELENSDVPQETTDSTPSN